MSVKYSKALTLLLIFSLAFNVAFGGVWIYNRAAALASPPPPPAPPIPPKSIIQELLYAKLPAPGCGKKVNVKIHEWYTS